MPPTFQETANFVSISDILCKANDEKANIRKNYSAAKMLKVYSSNNESY